MRAQADARNGGSSSSSKRQVSKGAQHFDSMISALAARYGADDSEPPELPDAAFEPKTGPKKGAKAAVNSNSKKRAKGESPPDGDIPDAEFEALRAQMDAGRAARESASSSASSSTAKSTSKRRK